MADNFQLKALITGVDKLSPTLAGIRKNVASFRKNIEGTGLGKIGFKEALAGGAMAAPFIAGAHAAIEFESAMADVRKVVNFDNPGQFKEMGDEITKMSERLPMAANDIAKIVAAGGQSGIARSELMGFAQDAVKMGIAFDQTAEESGDMMAKWRTSFKMTQTQVVGLADKINYLGNTGPANARQISDIVTRVGPLGSVAGVASGQIAALGATMAGVGVEQEVAATGIKNFMLSITKGSAATKTQAQAFKSLRLDAKAVAAGMQKDAQGTMLSVLKRIAAVDAVKRPALLWAAIKTTMAAVWSWIKAAFAWTPLGQIVANWQPLMQFFSALWDFIKAAAAAGWEYLKEQIGFDPVQVVSAAWEPLVAWFKGFFDRVRPYIEPLMNAGEWVGGKVSGAADWVKGKATGAANFFSGNDGATVGAGLIAQGTGGLQGATQSLLAGRGNKAQLDGALVVRFENAPAGMRPEAAQTNQPGLKVTTNVGYRSLSGAP